MCFSGSDLCGNLGGLASKSGLSYIWANLEVKSKYCLNARSRFPEGSLLHVMCRASVLVGIVLVKYLNFTSIIALHLWLCKDVPIETSESLTCSYLLIMLPMLKALDIVFNRKFTQILSYHSPACVVTSSF